MHQKCAVSVSMFSRNNSIKFLDQSYQLKINKKDIKSAIYTECMKERTMPICFTAEQYNKIELVAKQKGMLNPSHLVEEALSGM